MNAKASTSENLIVIGQRPISSKVIQQSEPSICLGAVAPRIDPIEIHFDELRVNRASHVSDEKIGVDHRHVE